jgi:DNA-binding transcriptional LysR family regulator
MTEDKTTNLGSAPVFGREPDVLIGPAEDPYLRRWWVIPRNRFFNVYLHHIRHSDDDRALHDHPWWNLSILLRGSYVEHTPAGERLRRAGSLVLRRPEAAHRLEVTGGEVWTLFITGPTCREWGFHCPAGWVPWRLFVAPENEGEIGRGCGGAA